MMRTVMIAAAVVAAPMTATAAIEVEVFTCEGEQVTAQGTVTLDGFDDALRLADFNRPSDAHIILRGNSGYGSWFTPAEAEAACLRGEMMEIVRCFPNGATSVDRYWMGDAMRVSGIPALAPQPGQRVYLDQGRNYSWTSTSVAELQAQCTPAELVEITSAICMGDGTLDVNVSGFTEGFILNTYGDREGKTTRYFDGQRRYWTDLSTDELAVLCGTSDDGPVEDGMWQMTMSDFTASDACPAEVSSTIQAQVAGMTTTRQINWPNPFSMYGMFPDENATGSWEDNGGGNWSLLVNRTEMNGNPFSIVQLFASIESPTRISWNNDIQQYAFGNCRVKVTGELVKVGE